MAKTKPFYRRLRLYFKKITAWSGFWIVGNLTLAAVIAMSIIFGSRWMLDKGTRHGENLTVPDFVGKTEKEAYALADRAGMRIEITDSIYVKEGRGTVARQNPAAGSHVKEGRRILIVMRAKGVRKVSMPSLVGYSTRQALDVLEGRGLQVGQIIYDESVPTTNNVLKQHYKGRPVEPGDSLEAESAIDLIVGMSQDDCETMIPDVVGKKGMDAVETLHDYYLNVRSLRYDKGVKTYADRARAVVYKQKPDASELPVKMGTEITLYLKVESSEE